MKKNILITFAFLLFGASLFASQTQTSAMQLSLGSSPAKISPPPISLPIASGPIQDQTILRSNQLMLATMEKIKSGNLVEARKLVMEMIKDKDKYPDTPTEVFRAFASNIEKKFFELELKKEGNKAKVNWLKEPIADGFYLLAILDFQENHIKEALENIQFAISWNPDRSAFHSERGYIILNQGNSELAMGLSSYLRALETAYTTEDFATAMRGVGFVLVERGDLEGAMAAYQVAKKFDPQNPVAEQEIRFILEKMPTLKEKINLSSAYGLLKNRGIPTGISKLFVPIILEISDELVGFAKKSELAALLKIAYQIDPENAEIKKRLTFLDGVK
ncbi:MAG: tetratricopeptide repeat protein [Candidatus Riflebacteria bacterium]|nr:tetratricopeptide repeat protein [Candidatus Riflebacteria bacterium]